ncbi:MAG TPA: ADOP family duplicated permease [Thermoanaerobaculia bacterium]|nr:ADOP family duplicated permease [Thermoanaerobaculia bacterium]
MHGLVQDFRVALRQLRRRPWWSASIVAVLAIGLAGNAAMFSGFDTWVLRPLDFERPEELLHIGERHRLGGGQLNGMSGSDLEDLRRGQSSLAAVAAFRGTVFNLDDEAEPASKLGARIEHALFPMLGVRPEMGRLFLPEEDLPGQPGAVALIGDRLWRERFGAADDVLGRSLRIDGRVHQIVGVMPPGFEFPEWEQVWVPLGLDPQDQPRDVRALSVIGRLAPGHTLETARAEIAAAGAEVARLHPQTHDGWSFDAEPLRKRWVPDVIELALAVSLGAAVLVLLVICANVASLFLAASEPRARELALRSALGGGRLQLVRPLLCEGVVLALLGGGLGLGLAVIWLRAMFARIPLDPPYLFAMSLDLRAGLFAFALAVLAGFLCSVPPLLRSAGTRPAEELRGGRSAGTRRASRLRGGLVIAELALSTALVAGALLMVKSFLQQQEHEGGYRAEGLHLAQLALTVPGLEEAEARTAFLGRLHDAFAESAIVTGAGSATDGPTEHCGGGTRFEAEGRTVTPGGGDDGVAACRIAVAGDYFETLELAVVSGRPFAAEELERGADVAVVSEGLARRLWESTDVLGRRLRGSQGDERPWLRVVGVVGDVRPPRDMVDDGAAPEVQLYLPYPVLPHRGVALAVRSQAPAEQVATAVRAAIRTAGAPVAEVLTLDQALERQRWVTRFFSEQLAVYAVAALVVAALGVYGLLADAVARRRYEMAVRLALGARRREVVGLVARWGLYRVGAGIVAGLVLGLWVSRLAAGMLVGVKTWDPGVYLLVVVVLAGAAGVAALLPASRAARCDPSTLLREG